MALPGVGYKIMMAGSLRHLISMQSATEGDDGLGGGGTKGVFISNRIAYHISSSLNWGLAAALGTILLVVVDRPALVRPPPTEPVKLTNV